MKKVSLDNDRIFSALIASEAAIYEQLTALVGENAKEAVKTIRQHAVVSATCGLAVVVPGADLLAFVANTWTMYARINKALGISLSKNILKSIATAVGTNVVSILPGMAIGSLAGSLMKAFPGIGTIGGMAVSGTTYYAIAILFWLCKAKKLKPFDSKTSKLENITTYLGLLYIDCNGLDLLERNYYACFFKPNS